VAPGLARLKRTLLLAPVSNGNISLMVDLARRNGFPWDAILGSEIAGDYKPKPSVYLAACAAFDLPPEHCMMVAAHSGDLASAAPGRAAGAGLRPRPGGGAEETGARPGGAGPKGGGGWARHKLARPRRQAGGVSAPPPGCMSRRRVHESPHCAKRAAMSPADL